MPQYTTEKTPEPVQLSKLEQIKRNLSHHGFEGDALVRDIIEAYETEKVKNFPFLTVPENATVRVTYNREFVLDSAKQCVCKDRQNAYGPPENSFVTIAAMWEAYLKVAISAHDVAAMMILLKVARIKTAPFNIDNWIDGAGYAACGGEIASNKKVDNS